MTLTVAERGRTLATFRFVAVRLMETAAAWTPTTPEMEAKVLFGRHIWDFAQHADALGRRTFELRLPAQHSLPPAEAFQALLERLAALTATGERLHGLYEGVLPGLERRCREYLAATDPVLDGPSCLVLERILQDFSRQRRDAAALAGQLGTAAPAPGWLDSWQAAGALVQA